MAWNLSVGDVVLYRLREDDADLVEKSVNTWLDVSSFGGFAWVPACSWLAGMVMPMVVADVQRGDGGAGPLVSGRVFVSLADADGLRRAYPAVVFDVARAVHGCEKGQWRSMRGA